MDVIMPFLAVAAGYYGNDDDGDEHWFIKSYIKGMACGTLLSVGVIELYP